MRSGLNRVFGVCATILQAATTEAFEGTLLEPDQSPMSRARVSVVGHAGTGVTGADGHFELTPDPQPPFQLLVTRADGVTLRPILVESLPTDVALVIVVPPELDEAITVVGGLIAELEIPPAAADTLLGRGDLQQRTPERLYDAVENIPGAWRTEESASAVPSLRGLASGRTLLLLDDARVSAERRAGPSASYLHPETLEKIEVIRGPGSVAYGSDAFGGVIRAVSRQPEADAPTSVRLALTGATGTGEGSVSGEVTTGILGGGALAGFHLRSLDDYESPEGEVFNSGAKDHGLRLGFTRGVGKSELTLGLRLDRGRDVEKPDTASEVEAFTYPEENSTRITAAYQIPNLGPFRELEIGGFWDSYQLITDRERFATDEVTRRIREADVDAQDYGLRIEAEQTLSTWGALKLGVDANGRTGLHAVDRVFSFDDSGAPTTSTEMVTVDSANRHDLAAFVGFGASSRTFQFSAGLRGDQVWTDNSGGYFGDKETSNSSLSGFAAVSWSAFPGVSLSLQASRGFRDPTLSDRYFRGVSGRGFVTGNPDLEPETSRQLDASVRYTAARFSVSAFGYVYRIDDLIERYQDGDSFAFLNRGEGEVRGFELEAYVSLTDSLRLEMGGQTCRGQVLDDETPTDNVPPTNAFLMLRVDPSQRWWGMARVAVVAKDDRPGPTEIETPDYALFDLGAGTRLNKNFTIQVQATNLFDTSYPSGADALATLAPGRSLQATVRFEL